MRLLNSGGIQLNAYIVMAYSYGLCSYGLYSGSVQPRPAVQEPCERAHARAHTRARVHALQLLDAAWSEPGWRREIGTGLGGQPHPLQ